MCTQGCPKHEQTVKWLMLARARDLAEEERHQMLDYITELIEWGRK